MNGWVDRETAASSVGVTERTIRAWIKAGYITQRRGRVSLAEVREWKDRPKKRKARPRLDIWTQG